ncbi:MAG TPA: hypothetical protein VEL76_37260 [Gemmataceae bacterium]|nr:hypothetical protein [Gemmataceae bacterium]
MARSSSALAEYLAGKKPAVMCDALWAGRYLSERGLASPGEVLNLIETVVGRRQRAVTKPALLLRLADALAESEFLNQAGKWLAAQATWELARSRAEETPMTKQEYLERLRINSERYPAVDGCENPPLDWVAQAWDLREIRKSMVDDGMADDVVRNGRIHDTAVPFLKELSPVLRTDQVVEAFLIIRDAAPHKERAFRPQFEQVFHQHAHALPALMTRQEVLDFLHLDKREGQWFCDGKPVTAEQLIGWLRLDEGEARWLLEGVGDPESRRAAPGTSFGSE